MLPSCRLHPTAKAVGFRLATAVTNHFKTEERVVEAPFDGLILGALENPVAAPGHPLCHLLELDRETKAEISREIERGEFDGYRAHGDAWADD